MKKEFAGIFCKLNIIIYLRVFILMAFHVNTVDITGANLE